MDKKELEVLNKFINNEMQKDKLERDARCGGWKIGDVYKHLELNVAIEKALKELDKQNKIIDKMAYKIAKLNVSDQYCKNKCPYDIPNAKDCAECIKKYYDRRLP